MATSNQSISRRFSYDFTLCVHVRSLLHTSSISMLAFVCVFGYFSDTLVRMLICSSVGFAYGVRGSVKGTRLYISLLMPVFLTLNTLPGVYCLFDVYLLHLEVVCLFFAS
jgi:hypothetical protein